ncbi:MAG: hypothetical protein LBP89_01420 [Helicobacteraceae bacterium]|jgi:hypothetical protein|nr:hypothetical protein [Helicobacteraceae bacterium]
MINSKPRDIDITKATIFILAIFFVSLALIYFTFIPDMRRLKLAVMGRDRADITLRQTQTELELQRSNLINMIENRNEDLAVLKNEFTIERFYQDATRFFSKSDFATIKIDPSSSTRLSRVTIDEYNVSVALKEPTDFYDFIEFINNYKNAVEISLPISVKADSDYQLNWSFGIKVYRSTRE